ncbi:carbonic anhydrase [Virgisporangium aliadipatigenens]|uniref:carbonic anhydrase n=1 Tax=Virgisporangium aliadipatigenens TaxID=741659 RepID=A0A8J3YWY0_9ACTN|nr:SulP family inorganic anion transporter [Virgisporangium aliadipatigenens]GIJ52113.1 carbonic anhydrase [Virgisporangium aliadipatigenens]
MDRPLWKAVARTVLAHDLPASFVVFLIAIPLSLGIAAASGAPLMAGMIAAVVGGVVAGVLGGSRLQVTGPAAGLTVLVAGIVAEFGWAGTTVIVALAGMVQVLLGLSRLARTALTLSPAVVHGMLAGIGVVIALSQVHVLLGGEPQSSAARNLRDLPAQLIERHDAAVTVGLLTVAILLGWPRVVKAFWLPAPLVAVGAATAVAAVWDLDLARVDLPDDPLGAIAAPVWPDAPAWPLAVAVVSVALVASVESLLSAVAIDKLHDGPPADLDRELLAQGAANAVSGALGGLPVTGVIVRGSTNVAAGARTRASTILHAVWVAGAVLLAAGALELIPLSALAAVLVVVGVRLVDTGHIRTFRRYRELPAYAVTVLGVVFVDLIAGVVLGMVVALATALWRLAHCRVSITQPEGGRWRVEITGTLFFLGVSRLAERLRAIPPGGNVTVLLHLDFLDHAAFEAIDGWRQAYEKQGGTVSVEEQHDTWFRRAAAGSLGGAKSLPRALPRWLFSGARSGGAHEYERSVAPLVRPLMADLARHGQAPDQLFITCADSRLVPNVITASGPGDLFCVRNVGNIVPPYRAAGQGTGGDHSVGAAIEYAVDVLRVRTITVCGHSSCGAVRALHEGGGAEGTALREWLAQARLTPAGGPAGELRPAREPLPELDQLSVDNVLQQLANLRTHPSVTAAEAAGRLRLEGMFYDLATARVHRIEPALIVR